MSIHPQVTKASRELSLDPSTFARAFHTRYGEYVGLRWHKKGNQYQYVVKREFDAHDGSRTFQEGEWVPKYMVVQMMTLVVESEIEYASKHSRDPETYVLTQRSRCLVDHYVRKCVAMLPNVASDGLAEQ